VRNEDKEKLIDVGRNLAGLGFSLVATRGTAAALEAAGLKVQTVNKVMEGRPHVVDMLKNKEVSLIVNTVDEDRRSIQDSWSIRNSALQNRITYYTTLSGARAACLGMQHLDEMRAYDIQSLHASLP
jgi:carbamoyl-phosphate synthase large subunit